MFKNNTKLFIGAGVVLVLLGLWFFSNQNKPLTQTSDISKIDREADREDTTIMEDKDMRTMLMSDSNTLTGSLVDVSGGNSSGTGYVLRKGGTLYHYAEADLPIPAEGSVYEGWLVKQKPTLMFFSTGIMEQTTDGYNLSYMGNDEYPGYDFVVITEETVVDETPEEHIIEGVVN